MTSLFTQLQCYACGLRFCEMDEVRLHHYTVQRSVNIGRGDGTVRVLGFIMDDGKQNDSGNIELLGPSTIATRPCRCPRPWRSLRMPFFTSQE